MNILVAWQESIKDFLFRGFIDDIKAGQPIASMWRFIKYSAPLFLVFACIAVLIVLGIGGWTAVGILFGSINFFGTVALILSVKEIHFQSHYTKSQRFFMELLTVSVIMFFFFAFLALFQVFLSINLDNIGSVYFLSLLPVGMSLDLTKLLFSPLILFSPLTIFFICFIFDSGLSIKNIVKSVYNAVKMAIYAYPVCLFLFYALVSLYRSYIVDGLDKFLLILVDPLPERLSGILSLIMKVYLPALVGVLMFSIFVGFYKNQRKKYPKLYK